MDNKDEQIGDGMKETRWEGSPPGPGRLLAAKPFRPHPLLRGGHAQTVGGWAWPRRFRPHPVDEPRLFEVEPGVRLLARCRWHEDRLARTTLVLVHGLGGSADAPYMLGTALLAYKAGANVV
ncbi:MAG TPA: hypothetical protein VFJ72_11420, partial [Rubrobacteraceae bacterium]|nr:hypothetical protein [Rubrobacteraceae bacterium]